MKKKNIAIKMLKFKIKLILIIKNMYKQLSTDVNCFSVIPFLLFFLIPFNGMFVCWGLVVRSFKGVFGLKKMYLRYAIGLLLL